MKFSFNNNFKILLTASFVLVTIFLIFLSQINKSIPNQSKSDITLEVVPIITTYGISGITPQPCLSEITASAPEKLINQLAAYCVAGRLTIIGPKDWKSEAGIGADGSLHLNLHPEDNSSPPKGYISVSEIPGCVACALGEAARYFEEAKKLYEKDFPAPLEISQDLEIKAISSSLVSYSMPGLENNLKTKGVVYFKMTNDHPYFIKMELAMFDQQVELSDFLLEDFILRERLE